MASFQFVDSMGTAWMVLPGLPGDHPQGEPSHGGPLTGLTFRADTGLLRVLPSSSFPRPASTEIDVLPLSMGSRIRPVEAADWEGLLHRATTWPIP